MPKHFSDDSLHEGADNSPRDRALAGNHTEPGCFNTEIFTEQNNKVLTLQLC